MQVPSLSSGCEIAQLLWPPCGKQLFPHGDTANPCEFDRHIDMLSTFGYRQTHRNDVITSAWYHHHVYYRQIDMLSSSTYHVVLHTHRRATYTPACYHHRHAIIIGMLGICQWYYHVTHFHTPPVCTLFNTDWHERSLTRIGTIGMHAPLTRLSCTLFNKDWHARSLARWTNHDSITVWDRLTHRHAINILRFGQTYRHAIFILWVKFMLPKRRFGKDEQKMKSGFSTDFSMVRSPNWVLTPLKSASNIRISSFVHPSQIFVWEG